MISDKQVMKAATRSMESSANLTRAQLKRGLNALATIGATAPFVGLFGTVIGIMNSFRTSTAPITHMGAVSGGISEALVTTSLGLLVAVPAVWAYNYFSTQLESLDLEMDNSVDATLTYLSGFQAMKRNR